MAKIDVRQIKDIADWLNERLKKEKLDGVALEVYVKYMKFALESGKELSLDEEMMYRFLGKPEDSKLEQLSLDDLQLAILYAT